MNIQHSLLLANAFTFYVQLSSGCIFSVEDFVITHSKWNGFSAYDPVVTIVNKYSANPAISWTQFDQIWALIGQK